MENLYASANPLVRFFFLGRLDAIAKALPHREKLRVLDAGCGEGHLVEVMQNMHPSHSYTGVDITSVALAKTRKRCPKAKFQKADLTQLPYKNASFDVVVCTEVIEHIGAYKKLIEELKRVLKRGGLLVMTFPNEFNLTIARFFLGRRPVKVPDHVNSFKPRAMRRDVGLEYLGGRNLPFPLPFFMSFVALQRFKR